jgi:hypothetical protein
VDASKMQTLQTVQINDLAKEYKDQLLTLAVPKDDAKVLARAIARFKLTATPLNPLEDALIAKYPKTNLILNGN